MCVRVQKRERETPGFEASSIERKSDRALHSSRSLGPVTGPFNNRITVLITAVLGLILILGIFPRFESNRPVALLRTFVRQRDGAGLFLF